MASSVHAGAGAGAGDVAGTRVAVEIPMAHVWGGIESLVKEFKPFDRIAWSAQGTGVSANHAWLVEAQPEGCRVLTAETQYGWMARAQKMVFPKRILEQHRVWLGALKRKVERGGLGALDRSDVGG